MDHHLLGASLQVGKIVLEGARRNGIERWDRRPAHPCILEFTDTIDNVLSATGRGERVWHRLVIRPESHVGDRHGDLEFRLPLGESRRLSRLLEENREIAH